MKTKPPNKAIVTITDDFHWSERDFISISGERYSMLYRVNVQTDAGVEEHLIVCPLPHSISQAERNTINRHLHEMNAKATISFYIADRDEWTQLITSPDEDFNPFNLAAAVAVIKRSCRWDEGVVEINGAEIRLWPRFDGQHWVVEDIKEANYEGLS